MSFLEIIKYFLRCKTKESIEKKNDLLEVKKEVTENTKKTPKKKANKKKSKKASAKKKNKKSE